MSKRERIIRAVFDDWMAYMQQPVKVTLQYGDFSGLPPEAKAMTQGGELGVTFGNADNSDFIVCISDKTPFPKIEQVVVHELVHVWSFSQAGEDPRANMEMVTDELAKRLIAHRRSPRTWRKVTKESFEKMTKLDGLYE